MWSLNSTLLKNQWIKEELKKKLKVIRRHKEWGKIVEQKNPKLTSCHGHTKMTTTDKAIRC